MATDWTTKALHKGAPWIDAMDSQFAKVEAALDAFMPLLPPMSENERAIAHYDADLKAEADVRLGVHNPPPDVPAFKGERAAIDSLFQDR